MRMGTKVLLGARFMKLDFKGQPEAAMATLLGPHTQRSGNTDAEGDHARHH